MHKSRSVLALALAVGVIWTAQPDAASVKVRADFDKAFKFSEMRTWQWADDPGQVILARTQGEDKDAVRRRAEPVILEEVAAAMPKRGITLATDAPDLKLAYYLVMTVGASSQYMGQFAPTNWGLPLFAPSTSSLEAVERGALVLDLSSQGHVVWRGIGEAGFTMDLDAKKREALLREAVKKVLERYPPKQKT